MKEIIWLQLPRSSSQKGRGGRDSPFARMSICWRKVYMVVVRERKRRQVMWTRMQGLLIIDSASSHVLPGDIQLLGFRFKTEEVHQCRFTHSSCWGGCEEVVFDKSTRRTFRWGCRWLRWAPSSPATKAPVQKVVYPEKLKRTGRRVNNVSTFSMIAGWSFSLTKLLYSS